MGSTPWDHTTWIITWAPHPGITPRGSLDGLQTLGSHHVDHYMGSTPWDHSTWIIRWAPHPGITPLGSLHGLHTLGSQHVDVTTYFFLAFSRYVYMYYLTLCSACNTFAFITLDFDNLKYNLIIDFLIRD